MPWASFRVAGRQAEREVRFGTKASTPPAPFHTQCRRPAPAAAATAGRQPSTNTFQADRAHTESAHMLHASIPQTSFPEVNKKKIMKNPNRGLAGIQAVSQPVRVMVTVTPWNKSVTRGKEQPGVPAQKHRGGDAEQGMVRYHQTTVSNINALNPGKPRVKRQLQEGAQAAEHIPAGCFIHKQIIFLSLGEAKLNSQATALTAQPGPPSPAPLEPPRENRS